MSRPLTVMSWNLYLGAEVQPLIGAPPDKVPGLWTTVWETVATTNFPDRCRTLAKHIAECAPDVLFLQEAYRWTAVRRVGAGQPSRAVVHDFVPDLVGALAGLGAPYFVACRAPGVFLQLPTVDGPDLLMEDSVAILLRAGSDALQGWRRPQRGSYATTLTVTVDGDVFPIARGWASVDVDYDDRLLRLVNTHLEYYGTGVRPGQVAELLKGPLAGGRCALLGGDFNAKPKGEIAKELAKAGFHDAWTQSGCGFTSAQAEFLDNPESKLDERIDWLLARSPLRAHGTRLVGHRPEDRTAGGLWPSDHAAVLASYSWAGDASGAPTAGGF